MLFTTEIKVFSLSLRNVFDKRKSFPVENSLHIWLIMNYGGHSHILLTLHLLLRNPVCVKLNSECVDPAPSIMPDYTAVELLVFVKLDCFFTINSSLSNMVRFCAVVTIINSPRSAANC